MKIDPESISQLYLAGIMVDALIALFAWVFQGDGTAPGYWV